MKRLNGVDAFMLGMETSKSYMHTFKVAIIDPSTDPDGWSFGRFYEESAGRIHLVPILRWKYLDSPPLSSYGKPYTPPSPTRSIATH